MQSILAKWASRTSSLFAKIMIVNTLIMSLFVYKMLVLQPLSKGLLDKIRNATIKYLWNNNCPKTSYSFLTMCKEDSGACLIDLASKQKALKVSWIQILENEAELKTLVQFNTVPILKDNTWDCNLR